MASDKAFRVRWPAGEIIVHGSDAKSAIEVALEFMRVADSGRIVAKEMSEWEDEVKDAIRSGDAQV